MRAIVALDQEQLRRIEEAIARVEQRPFADRQKAVCLLTALRNEREEILRYHPRRPYPSHSTSLAA